MMLLLACNGETFVGALLEAQFTEYQNSEGRSAGMSWAPTDILPAHGPGHGPDQSPQLLEEGRGDVSA